MIDPKRTAFAPSTLQPTGAVLAFPASARVRPEPATEPNDDRVVVSHRGRTKVYASPERLRAELLGPPDRGAAAWSGVVLLVAFLAGLAWGMLR